MYLCMYMYVYMKVDLKDMNRESGVIAHFLAHRGDNLRLAVLAFDPTYVFSTVYMLSHLSI